MRPTWLMDTFDVAAPIAAATMAGPADGTFAVACGHAGIVGGIGVSATASASWVEREAGIARAAGIPYTLGFCAWALARDREPLVAGLAQQPAAIVISFGDIATPIAWTKAQGATVLAQVGSVAAAKEAVAAGADAVIARGSEGGGHGAGTTATLPLLAATLDEVDVPVLAGGGISGPRSLAAVMAAGAAGAWVGTALATCRESAWPDDVVSFLGTVGEGATAYGHVFDHASQAGWPADVGGRAIRNAFFDQWSGREHEMDQAARQRFRDALVTRDFDTMAVYAGEGISYFDGIRRPVAEVVAHLTTMLEGKGDRRRDR